MLTEHNDSGSFKVTGDDQTLFTTLEVTRPSSLNLGRLSCPVCRLARTPRRRPPVKPAPRRASSAAVGFRDDPTFKTVHVTRLAKDHLPSPPPLLPAADLSTCAIYDENLTEVSILSEESYFTHDEQTLVLQPGSFHHFEVDSQQTYSEDSVLISHSNIPLSDCRRTQPDYTRPAPHWPPPYMPPTPPIPHDYYATSSKSSCPYSVVSRPPDGELDPGSHRHKSRVWFSDKVNIRIIFDGEQDRDFVVDTQSVDVFPLRSYFTFGPIRVVVVAVPSSPLFHLVASLPLLSTTRSETGYVIFGRVCLP